MAMNNLPDNKDSVMQIEQSAYFPSDSNGDVEKIQQDVRVSQKKTKEERRLILKQDLLILPLLSGSLFFVYLVRCTSPDSDFFIHVPTGI